MNKEIEIFGNTILANNTESRNFIELEYYKIRNNVIAIENIKPYGIGITKKCCDEIELNIEQREFNNIFASEKEANKMLELLLKNKVTPVSLKDILEDFVLV